MWAISIWTRHTGETQTKERYATEAEASQAAARMAEEYQGTGVFFSVVEAWEDK